MAKASSKQQEALQLLDDLDNLSGPEIKNPAAVVNVEPAAGSGQAADVLAFIDEVTQKSSEPSKPAASRIMLSRPSSRASNTSPSALKKKSFDLPRAPTPLSATVPTQSSTAAAAAAPASISTAGQSPEPSPQYAASGWGWGSVWSSTTAALQQARTVVDDQVRGLSTNEQARKLQEGVLGYVKTANLDKIGRDLKNVSFSALTDIINAVAPPISEHEVLKVSISHDMEGYGGLEAIVYQALSKVMEQVQGGDLIVNKGTESKPKDSTADSKRTIDLVDGADAALKLAQASLEDLIKSNPPAPKTEATPEMPVSYTSLYLRIQPFAAGAVAEKGETGEGARMAQFLIVLREPTHDLTHETVTQAVPSQWLEVWDTNEWVEDLIVDSLRLGVQVVGQTYLIARMGMSSKTTRPEQS